MRLSNGYLHSVHKGGEDGEEEFEESGGSDTALSPLIRKAAQFRSIVEDAEGQSK